MCSKTAINKIDPNGGKITLSINMPPMGQNSIDITYKIHINNLEVNQIDGDNISITDDSNKVIECKPGNLIGKLLVANFYITENINNSDYFSFVVKQGERDLSSEFRHKCDKYIQTCTLKFE